MKRKTGECGESLHLDMCFVLYFMYLSRESAERVSLALDIFSGTFLYLIL